MKLTKTSRVTAMILALLMIVPLISVPVFAEDSATIIAKHTFDDITAVSDSIANSHPSLSLEAVEGRGNVLKFDLTDGASGSDDTFYLAKNQNNGKVAVAECAPNVDNTYNGYFMDGSTKVYFKNANGTTKTYATRAKTTFYILGDDGVEEVPYTYGGEASGWYLMTEAAINAWRGGGNIAAAIKVKHDAITSNVTTYSADYYFDGNFTVTGENKLFGDNFQGFNVSNSGDSVKFNPHTNLGEVTDGAAFTVADNTWVNLSFVIDWANGTYKLYADGVYKFTAKATGDSYAPGANTWELIQANRGQGSAYDGFVMIDNATIYEGEVLPAYSYTETFDGTIGSKIQSSFISKDGVSVVDGTVAGKDASDKVLQLTVPEGFNTTSYPYAVPMDVNGMINTPEVDANSGLVVLQEDVYIPTDTRVKLQTQVYAYNIPEATKTQNYLSLWNIYAKADGTVSLTSDGKKSATYASDLKRDTWHTIKTVLDLKTGYANVYADGQLYFILNTTKTNITVLADSITFAKANKFDTSGYGDCFVGSVYFDNLSFSTADASAMTTPPASYTVNFDNGLGDGQTKYYLDSCPTAAEIVSGSAYGKAQDDLVLKLETTNAEDKNRSILHSSYTYDYETDNKLLVMQEDILIPAGTAVQLQSQIHGATADGAAISYASLWQIEAKDTSKDGTLKNDTTGINESTFNSVIPRGEWFTICTVLDLETGWVEIYIDGELRMEYFWKRGSVQLKNIKGNGSHVYMVKINKNANYNGGAVLFNNVSLYTAKPANLVESRFFSYDYEAMTDGTHAVSANNAGPASATYTKMDDGNTAIKFEMFYADPNAANVKGDFVFGPASRLYFLNGVPTDGTVVAVKSSWNDWTIIVSRDDTTAYVYATTKDAALIADPAGTAEGKTPSKHTVVKADDPEREEKYEMALGSVNTDKNFFIDHGKFTYSAKTVVFSADYFISADAAGTIQSQINNGSWNDLYYFYCDHGNFEVAGGSAMKYVKDAWNNVKMVATIADNNSATLDIYFNGVYCGSRSISGGITADSWIAAKIMKNANMNNAGYFYLDNVSAVAYDAAQAGEIDFTNVVSYTVGGETVVNTLLSGVKATYGATVTATTVADYFAANKLIETEDLASMRLELDYPDYSGLRFATEVNVATLEAIADLGMSVTEMGTLIAPASYGTLDLENFTAYVDGADVTATTILKVVAGAYNDNVDADESTTHFVGSIVKIHEGNIDRAFSGRGYMTVKLANGTVVNVYSDYTKSISVKEQAQATIDAKVYEVDSPEYNILVGFAGSQA